MRLVVDQQHAAFRDEVHFLPDIAFFEHRVVHEEEAAFEHECDFGNEHHVEHHERLARVQNAAVQVRDDLLPQVLIEEVQHLRLVQLVLPLVLDHEFEVGHYPRAQAGWDLMIQQVLVNVQRLQLHLLGEEVRPVEDRAHHPDEIGRNARRDQHSKHTKDPLEFGHREDVTVAHADDRREREIHAGDVLVEFGVPVDP